MVARLSLFLKQNEMNKRLVFMLLLLSLLSESIFARYGGKITMMVARSTCGMSSITSVAKRTCVFIFFSRDFRARVRITD